jgi:aryl carrier-like protein
VELGEVISGEGVTTLWLTASLYNAVLDEHPEALRGLKQLLIGGEALSVRHVRRGLELLPGTRIINGYGPTESTTFTCCHPIPPELPEGVGSIPIGRPIGNTRVYVLDEGMRQAPIGVAGELFIGGDGLARGYLNRPELTAEKFVPHPFAAEGGGRLYRTGDLVKWRADGTIEFLGRTDHQVKVRGFRIELGEIEAALRRHPGVREAVALMREDAPGEKRLVGYVVGYVVPAEGRTSEAAELRACLETGLPEYMVPSAFVFLETLPLTPNGKVDLGALPAPEGRAAADEALVPPRNDLERRIVAIWKEVLHLDQVGVHDNFFDLGGHSLTLLRVHGRLRETQPDVTIVDLFEYPTVSALAAHLTGRVLEPEAVSAAARPSREGREAARERLGRRRGIRTVPAHD